MLDSAVRASTPVPTDREARGSTRSRPGSGEQEPSGPLRDSLLEPGEDSNPQEVPCVPVARYGPAFP